MFEVGQKIVYGEHGVCTVDKVAPLDMSGVPKTRLYYHLSPLVGSGTFFAPVDSEAYMRPVMDRRERAPCRWRSMPAALPHSPSPASM